MWGGLLLMFVLLAPVAFILGCLTWMDCSARGWWLWRDEPSPLISEIDDPDQRDTPKCWP